MIQNHKSNGSAPVEQESNKTACAYRCPICERTTMHPDDQKPFCVLCLIEEHQHSLQCWRRTDDEEARVDDWRKFSLGWL